MTLNERLLGGNQVHILVLCYFVIFVLILPFKNHVFLQGFSPRRVNSRLSEFDVKKYSFRAGNLAQARQMALKRVLRRKI